MSRIAVSIAAATMLLLMGSARADMIYQFVQTSSAGGWSGGSVGLSLDLSDAAVASGSVQMTQNAWPFWQSGTAGLVSLVGSAPSLQVGNGVPGGGFTLALTFNSLGQIATSSITVQTQTTEFTLTGGAKRSKGTYLTDNPGVCYSGGACTFGGYWTAQTTSVPEPSSLAILGAGLLAMGALRYLPRVRARR